MLFLLKKELNDTFKLNPNDFFLCVRLRRAKIPVKILHFSSVDNAGDGQNTDLPAMEINSSWVLAFFFLVMTRFIRLWNSPQGGSFNFRCPCKNLIRIQLIATNLSWLVYFAASLMENEQRRKTDTICITMRSRANFKAGMKMARSSRKASSVFGPSLAKKR